VEWGLDTLDYSVETLAQRLRSTICTIEGAAIVSVQVAVVGGEIQFITRPTVTNVEPKNRRDEFISLLAFGAEGVDRGPCRSGSDQDQPFDGLLTGAEGALVDQLAQAYNSFTSLPVLHAWDQREFMDAVHKAQHIVLARPTKRMLKTTSR